MKFRKNTFAALCGIGAIGAALLAGANPPVSKPKPKLPLKQSTAKPQASAAFIGRDDKTQGNWYGVYGKEAFTVPVQLGKSSYQIPTVTMIRGKGATKPTKAASPILEGTDENQFAMTDWDKKIIVDDKRLPQRGPSMTERHATVFTVRESPLIIRLDTTDSKPHRLSLYVLDFLRKKKAIRVEIKTLSGTTLDSRRVENYSNGAYLKYRMRGSVLIFFSPLDKAMPELSGIFVDPI